MLEFEPSHLARIRAALLETGSADLIHLMHLRGLGQIPENPAPKAQQTAIDLNWVDADSGGLTPLGVCAADSCREYQFWLERDKVTPFDDIIPSLMAAGFEGARVLEIGSGMGANLMSIAAAGAEDICGIEPVPAYIQLGAILCEREGLIVPEVRQGSAEAIPFDDKSADLVLCISAHQYFEILPAFQELARIQPKGGEMILIGGTLQTYMRDAFVAVLKERRGAAAFVITTLNSLSYMAIGRRVIPARTGFSTSRPIYPTLRTLRRWLKQVGFEEISPTGRLGPESCLHLRKV